MDDAGRVTVLLLFPEYSVYTGARYDKCRPARALATDFNPGSTPSGNMNFVVAAACIKMKMTPEEAINAATINGAYAMGISRTHGSITVGKKATVIVTKKNSVILPAAIRVWQQFN